MSPTFSEQSAFESFHITIIIVTVIVGDLGIHHTFTGIPAPVLFSFLGIVDICILSKLHEHEYLSVLRRHVAPVQHYCTAITASGG